jgi:cell wall assembly regulator SMI1
MSSRLDPVEPLKRIEAWVSRNHPDRVPFLRPGADGRSLRRIETKLGKPLPPDIWMLYAAHDGQPEGAPNLYLNQRWLPLDLVRVAWEDLCLRYGDSGTPNGKWPLQTAVWSTSWLPLFGSSHGDHYCIDLRPERGDSGRVIWFLYDQPKRAIIAKSIAHLLWRVANGVAAGEWRLDNGYDGLSD